jgi:hypothetical protein
VQPCSICALGSVRFLAASPSAVHDRVCCTHALNSMHAKKQCERLTCACQSLRPICTSRRRDAHAGNEMVSTGEWFMARTTRGLRRLRSRHSGEGSGTQLSCWCVHGKRCVAYDGNPAPPRRATYTRCCTRVHQIRGLCTMDRGEREESARCARRHLHHCTSLSSRLHQCSVHVNSWNVALCMCVDISSTLVCNVTPKVTCIAALPPFNHNPCDPFTQHVWAHKCARAVRSSWRGVRSVTSPSCARATHTSKRAHAPHTARPLLHTQPLRCDLRVAHT